MEGRARAWPPNPNPRWRSRNNCCPSNGPPTNRPFPAISLIATKRPQLPSISGHHCHHLDTIPAQSVPRRPHRLVQMPVGRTSAHVLANVLVSCSLLAIAIVSSVHAVCQHSAPASKTHACPLSFRYSPVFLLVLRAGPHAHPGLLHPSSNEPPRRGSNSRTPSGSGKRATPVPDLQRSRPSCLHLPAQFRSRSGRCTARELVRRNLLLLTAQQRSRRPPRHLWCPFASSSARSSVKVGSVALLLFMLYIESTQPYSLIGRAGNPTPPRLGKHGVRIPIFSPSSGSPSFFPNWRESCDEHCPRSARTSHTPGSCCSSPLSTIHGPQQFLRISCRLVSQHGTA